MYLSAPDFGPADDAEAPPPFAILLAGGRGSRLYELTNRLCKPAVPFLGTSRIVDFVMQNLVASGQSQVLVATQYQPEALERHVKGLWGNRLGGDLSVVRGTETPEPGQPCFTGTADAVWKNAAAIDASGAKEVLILSADHVYNMDYRPLIAAHRASGAGITVAATVVTLEEARGFGVIEAAPGGRIRSFVEKPVQPKALPDLPGQAMASMGIYVCSWAWLRRMLAADAQDPTSSHDFGKDILPAAVAAGRAHAWAWADPAGTFWRDVGTLDSLRETIIAFAGANAPFELPEVMPRRPLAAAPSPDWRYGAAPVAPRPRLSGTVIMPGAHVPADCRLTRTIVAPFTRLPEGLVTGEDPDEDARWFRVTEGGTVLITPEMVLRREAHSPRRALGVPSSILRSAPPA